MEKWMKPRDLTNLSVEIGHPFGTIRVPLEEWIRIGPGERIGLRPQALYDDRTGQRLAYSTIPLVYRNTWYSRLLIWLHLLKNPWN